MQSYNETNKQDNSDSNKIEFPTFFQLRILAKALKAGSVEKLNKIHNLPPNLIKEWKDRHISIAASLFNLMNDNLIETWLKVMKDNPVDGTLSEETINTTFEILINSLNQKNGVLTSYNDRSKVDDGMKDKIDENISMEYDGLNYLRLMKQFKPSIKRNFTIDVNKLPIKGFNILDEIDRHFQLRFYLPKKIITRKNIDTSERNKIVIMLNGMNEDRDFSFYDLLGEYFTSNNITAVLLPTPLHLNRRVHHKYKIEDPKTGLERNTYPTDWALKCPELFYFNYLKGHDELMELVEKINPPDDIDFFDKWNEKDKVDMAFYKKHFWNDVSKEEKQNTEIILLGYSLGGVKALSYFLNSEDKFRCCITFNSGPKVRKVNPKQLNIEEDDWKKLFADVQKYMRENNSLQNFELEGYSSDNLNIKNEIKKSVAYQLHYLFKDLYLGNGEGVFVEQMKYRDSMDRYLAITSGSDKIVNNGDFQDLMGDLDHIHQIIVAGVDHNPTIDQNWHHVLPRIQNNILEFIDSCREQHHKRDEIAIEMKKVICEIPLYKNALIRFYIHHIEYTPTVNHNEFYQILGEITQVEEAKIKNGEKIKKGEMVDKFLEIYYTSKGYYFNLSELFNKVLRDDKKERNQLGNGVNDILK